MVVLGGDYLRTDEVDNGDRIIFQDEGAWVESARWKNEDGSFKWDFIIKILWRGVDKSMRLNKTNREALITAFGNDTADWVNKEVALSKEKVMVAGKKMDTLCVEVLETAKPKASKKGPNKDADTDDVDTDNVIPF